MKTTYINRFLTVVALLIAGKASAQLNPVTATYFQNQYLANPAMAGLEKGIIADMNYRLQWTSVPGAPGTQTLSGEYGGEKVGLGFNVYNDKSGLLRNTRVMGSFAYHLPLGSNDQKLSFGLSAGFRNERLEYSDVKGDAGDVSVGRYNDNKAYFDGDFGLAYTDSKLAVQAALPDLKSAFHKDDNSTVDRATFFSAVSYKLNFSQALGGLSIQPKVAYRGIKGQDNIMDVGSAFGFKSNALNSMIMYHSNKSTTFGIGTTYHSNLSINTMYTTSSAPISSYTNGVFEIGLRAKFVKKKKPVLYNQ